MIVCLPLLLLCATSPSATTAPTALVFAQAETNQEPADATQEPGTEKPKPEKKKFARLSSPNKKIVQGGLRDIEKGEEQEEVEEGVAAIIAIGEAAIPMCLDATARMEKVGREDAIWQVLDSILVNDDLALAWKVLKKKAPANVRVYLTRRYADSERKDAAKFLQPLMESEDGAMAYQAARGLVLRGDTTAIAKIESQVRSRWLKESATFRADFAGVDRAPLSESVTPFLQRGRLKEKLAALRMFEMFGIKEHAPQLAAFLSESDTSLRLAAINACRVVLAGEKPLDRPSMTEIIERAEAWKAKL
ncbi:MAG: hypothetical protein GY747_05575 [Planctomycetes bacterium]|nr:hypothetical protein [Planctomycetota bacterium]MCP4770405.1 hypothetical protein [Planctomycetota bacterium]MCP4860503.1 hypothetical protein [Planctomycetota bacterium]